MAERMIHDSCEGCRHNLGGGCCYINEEAECGAGDRELWEEKRIIELKPCPFCGQIAHARRADHAGI